MITDNSCGQHIEINLRGGADMGLHTIYWNIDIFIDIILSIMYWKVSLIINQYLQLSKHKKASKHHANLPLEMYSFTL